MSLCDDRGLFATDKEMVRRRSVAALRDIDAVSHKKHRSACRRINQRFLKYNVKISVLYREHKRRGNGPVPEYYGEK